MVTIGEHSYYSGMQDISKQKLSVYFTDEADLVIGDYCSISCEVEIFLGGEHSIDNISQFPFSKLGNAKPNGHPFTKGNVNIGNDVWIGWGAAILSGVTIGDCAVIGAYSVVTSDVPDFAIVGGNPAKQIRLKYGPMERLLLKKIKWWKWPDEHVKNVMDILGGQDFSQLNAYYEANKADIDSRRKNEETKILQ